ncbi:HD domain-containing protein [Gemmatimonas sp.]|uniref:HD domain-containing protein n=1 Tax=Gemmatimonas sp. TaxID=1962908 RepID=UPI00356788E6
MKQFSANRQGQSLVAHYVLVGRLAQQIISAGYGGSVYGQAEGLAKVEQLKAVALVAGLLHDIGKVDQEFQ